jgi:hypothetical protein
MKNQYTKIHLTLHKKEKKPLTCKLDNRQRFGGIDVNGPGVKLSIPLTSIDVILAN